MNERCEGCGVEVTRGTLRNVLVDRSLVVMTDPRTGQPVYRYEAYKALCMRCQRGVQ
jgi:predicted  nucleic acid-binding Zn-ribbon protein